MAGKTLNSGQICLAPDYVMVPTNKRDEFIEAARDAVATMYPHGLKDDEDYTSVLNQRHFDRLQSYLEDARRKNAEITVMNPTDEDFSRQPHHKMAPCIVADVTDDMTVLQDEIFGPILALITYDDISEVVDYINKRPRPLALYYFGRDAAERDYVVNSTTSGGVTVNDVVFHVAQEDLPFGGIGPSGMGAYHGKTGFIEFSHRKAIYTQPSIDVLRVLRPPYGKIFQRLLRGRIKD